MRAVPWLVPLVLLAGCVVEEDPPLPAAVAPSPEPEVVEPAPEPTAEAAPLSSAPPPPPEPRVEPLAYEGRTGRWACVPDGVGSCQGHGLGAESENVVYVVPLPGVTRIEGSLEWAAATPATRTLTLRLAMGSPCGEGCYAWVDFAKLEGESPLAVAQDVALPEGSTLALVVDHEVPAQTPLVMRAGLDQAFAFEGQVTVQ